MVLTATGCGAASEPAARAGDAPAATMPAGDPSGGVYTYEQARAVGIDVPPIPSAAEMCPPPDPTYSGIRPEDIDTPEERAALERRMEKAPTCLADPRKTLYIVGHDVAAVRAAGSAFEKGRLICARHWFRTHANPDSLPTAAEEIRARVHHADGVEPSDNRAELEAGCRTTEWAKQLLLRE